mmetsp:Transcript_12794/g.19829  ORF Transcript_12794/g.19829 Transcript_12794/m.19829 type:complete len:474 (+) Transcript_12794:34-1455(+)
MMDMKQKNSYGRALFMHVFILSSTILQVESFVPSQASRTLDVISTHHQKSSKNGPNNDQSGHDRFNAVFGSKKRLTKSLLQMTPYDFLPTETLSNALTSINQDQAEALAGPLFGASLFPYLAFLYFLNVEENNCPKGVTVGFATCLLFVFLTIPAAIAAKLLYGASLADADWLHGSAESLLTITNLVTVVAFRQALQAEQGMNSSTPPPSAQSYTPAIVWVACLTAFATATALIPACTGAQQHTPYLKGILDFDGIDWTQWGAHPEPVNSLTIPTWIIHTSSLVEFLVAMGYCWRWADIVDNPKWKGLTWGLLPLHSSGITACTYHLFYNSIPILVPLQAFLTCVGNTTAAYAALRIALSNGWEPPIDLLNKLKEEEISKETESTKEIGESASLVGFEDLGDALAKDTDYSFLLKLFLGCGVASYILKYGALFFDFPFEANAALAVSIILTPSFLNAVKWWKRSQDPSFEGWF